MVMPKLNPIVRLPLAEALVLRGKELGCRWGGSAAAAIPPGHRLGSSCGPLALPSPSFPLMQSKKLHNGGKNKWVLVEPVTWGCAFAVNVSDIQGSGQPGSEGQQPASGQMNLSQDSRCTCSSLEASLCSLLSKWVFLRQAHHVEASENQWVALAQERRAHFNSFSFTLQALSTRLLLGYFHSRRGKLLQWWT